MARDRTNHELLKLVKADFARRDRRGDVILSICTSVTGLYLDHQFSEIITKKEPTVGITRSEEAKIRRYMHKNRPKSVKKKHPAAKPGSVYWYSIENRGSRYNWLEAHIEKTAPKK